MGLNKLATASNYAKCEEGEIPPLFARASSRLGAL